VNRGVRLSASLLAALVMVGCATPSSTVSDDRRERPKANSKPESPPAPPLAAKGPISEGWRITRVVDGDTVDVTRAGRTLTIRLIGIDTPETVHPTEPVECFGPEATEFATRRLLGEPATLEFDPSQGRLDYYGRTLAYVWTGDSLFNRDAVRRGYALEYTYDTTYRWQREFQRAEASARSDRLGVWRCPRPGS
jgi:micrococcal nuclease